MRTSLWFGCLLLSVSVCASACATIPVNSIANGRAPRVQAVVILAMAAVETGIAVAAAQAARSGETVCHMRPDTGVDFYEVANDCDGPIENTLGAVMFGVPATIDVGVAIYQLITNKPAYTYKPEPRRTNVVPPPAREGAPTSDDARLQTVHDGAGVQAPYELAPPSETDPSEPPVEYADRDACLRDRVEQQRRALAIKDLGERTRLLTALPDCSAPRAQ